MISEQEIISAIRKNPIKGFPLLMKAFGQPVYWYIRRLVVVHADAEDATQETFLRAYRKFHQFTSENSLKAWIFRIATNEALRLIARRQASTTVSLEEAGVDTLGLHPDAYFDSSDQMAVRFQQAIHLLPTKQQLAFNLRYYDELSYEEIALVADCTAASAKMNYHLAKEKIIMYLKKYF